MQNQIEINALEILEEKYKAFVPYCEYRLVDALMSEIVRIQSSISDLTCLDESANYRGREFKTFESSLNPKSVKHNYKRDNLTKENKIDIYSLWTSGGNNQTDVICEKLNLKRTVVSDYIDSIIESKKERL